MSSSNICHIPTFQLKKYPSKKNHRYPRLRTCKLIISVKYVKIYFPSSFFWQTIKPINALRWYMSKEIFESITVWCWSCNMGSHSCTKYSPFSSFSFWRRCSLVCKTYIVGFSLFFCVKYISMSKEIESINVFGVDPAIWGHKRGSNRILPLFYFLCVR